MWDGGASTGRSGELRIIRAFPRVAICMKILLSNMSVNNT